MIAETFNLAAYCGRIGFSGELRPDFATVQALMQHQLRSVPFENLDVLAGKPISLQPDDIVKKIIGRQRGGYCYEINGLFALALTALGVGWQFVAARPMFYPARRPRTHAALVVSLAEGQWLCDLGFGSYGIRAPLRLDVLDTPVPQDDDTFMLTQEEGDFILKALVEGEWRSQYGFNLCPVEWIDFAPANWMNSTHPDAVFTQKPLIVRFTEEGRSILFGDHFTQVAGRTVSKRTVAPSELALLLVEHFGLKANECSFHPAK
ncbi:arylamine N-acetyltransferase [Candidatus Thiothrix sp. Deng01]|uniref:Arylamine N-acetyltransferase n=1 Tax=Candidatus Thiothrix phosphatis TaxID=3112415 RepID=A0ABU6D0Y9_9GAMM|nr:arylamine N-acetyltransferase [Candidatus Thiothrix sp. Deng01]MEB4592027.1 arylamine N-acetyltransferase [Candidatus Thiothrix sp. Deng01]